MSNEQYNPLDRFTDDGSGLIVVYDCQCVGCINNLGFDDCEAYGKKPAQYFEDKAACPEVCKEQE